MLVVHAIWAYGALQVWAEDSALPAQAPSRAGRPSRAPRPHPFAAQPDALADALAEALAAAAPADTAAPAPPHTAPAAPAAMLAASPAHTPAAAQAGAGTGDLHRKAVDDEVTLRLPATADGPLASPALARPPADAAADPAP